MIENEVINDVKSILYYCVDGDMVAFIEYEQLFETVNIVNVYVLDTFRREGIATKLFEYLFENVSCERFMLEVNETNDAAIRLYEKFGFKKIHVRKNYYENEDALIMEARK